MHAITRGLDHCIVAVDAADSVSFTNILLVLILDERRKRSMKRRIVAIALPELPVVLASAKGVTDLQVEASCFSDS